MSDLGSRLQAIRKKAAGSPSQSEVAKSLNIAQSTYARFESGLREPPISFIVNFCKLFNVSADYLLGLSRSLSSAPQKSTPVNELLNAATPRKIITDLDPDLRSKAEGYLDSLFEQQNEREAASQQEA